MINHQKNVTQEEIARHWTLSNHDKTMLSQYRKSYRLFIAIQLCSVRSYGRFPLNCQDLSTEIINYLCRQLNLLPTLTVDIPTRKATLTEQRQNILAHLGFQKFEGKVISIFRSWIEDQARQGVLPSALIFDAKKYLLDQQIILPGPTVIERMIITICNNST